MNKRILSCVITGTLVMSCVSTGASAATKPVKSGNVGIQYQSQLQQSQTKENTLKVIDMVNAFGSYLKFNSNNELYLTKTASEIGVSQTEYNNFMKGVQLENKAIKKGELTLVLDKYGHATDVKSNLNINLVKDVKPDLNINSVKGEGQIKLDATEYNHWYGWQIKFTEGETVGLIKALGVGSGAAWLAGELSAAGIITIPVSIPFGIIAASCALSGAAVYAIDQGYGISIYYNNTAHAGWIWAN